MCIVTGYNQDIAIKLIKRMKALFEPHDITFPDKDTILELNGCTIEAFPSKHLDAYRALDNPKFIFIDEADFFRKSEQENVRHVSERYIGKSDPYIVMVSTPNAPGGLFESIEKDPEETRIYKRLKLDYTYGLGKIYTIEEIEKAKQSPSFEREYNLKYLGMIGNVFHTQDIEAAIEEGEMEYDPNESSITNSPLYVIAMGIDPAYGSSKFAGVIQQFRDGKIEIIYTKTMDRPLQSDALQRIRKLIQQYHSGKVFVDASAPRLIRELKIGYGEYLNYHLLKSEVLEGWISSSRNEPKIVPVNFAKKRREMLQHLYNVLAKGKIRIHLSFDNVIVTLRTSTTKVTIGI